jgi:hypothetical protein
VLSGRQICLPVSLVSYTEDETVIKLMQSAISNSLTIEDLLYDLPLVYENISEAGSVQRVCHNTEYNFDVAHLIISNGM